MPERAHDRQREILARSGKSPKLRQSRTKGTRRISAKPRIMRKNARKGPRPSARDTRAEWQIAKASTVADQRDAPNKRKAAYNAEECPKGPTTVSARYSRGVANRQSFDSRGPKGRAE